MHTACSPLPRASPYKWNAGLSPSRVTIIMIDLPLYPTMVCMYLRALKMADCRWLIGSLILFVWTSETALAQGGNSSLAFTSDMRMVNVNLLARFH